MKLEIKNLAIIKDASVSIDGITVIVGKNSTGKSTVGKALFSVFNSLYKIDDKIKHNRVANFQNLLWDAFYNSFNDFNDDKAIADDIYFDLRKAMRSLALKTDVTEDEISRALSECFENYEQDISEENCIKFSKDVKDIIAKINESSDIQLTMEVLERYFSRVFNNQINSLMTESVAEIGATIKEKLITIKFDGNRCIEAVAPFNILHEAFFIDNSTLIDEIDYQRGYRRNMSDSFQQQQLLSAVFRAENDIDEGMLESINAKKKLESIYGLLDQTIPGDISIQGKGVSVLLPNYKKPLSAKNLSTGMKSFALIKLMLEKGVLKEKDVLILDEPEVHLHPEWQMKYAEIIVLLQKYFDLSIIVTTHSSHFLRAIEYYAIIHKVDNNCNYYLSKEEEGQCIINDVTNDITLIYKELIEPSIMIDDMWYRMESEDE